MEQKQDKGNTVISVVEGWVGVLRPPQHGGVPNGALLLLLQLVQHPLSGVRGAVPRSLITPLAVFFTSLVLVVLWSVSAVAGIWRDLRDNSDDVIAKLRPLASKPVLPTLPPRGSTKIGSLVCIRVCVVHVFIV